MSANEQMNFFVNFFSKILHFLVVVAACTLTVWMTIGYYIVQIIIELLHADRNVLIAVTIIVGVLCIAFAITVMTNKHGSCCRFRSAGSRSKWKTATTSCAKKTKCGHCAVKAEAQSSDCQECPESSKSSLLSCWKKSFWTQRCYSDSEGRQIFLNNRRYAIPMEMKHPPALIVWLRDYIQQVVETES